MWAWILLAWLIGILVGVSHWAFDGKIDLIRDWFTDWVERGEG